MSDKMPSPTSIPRKLSVQAPPNMGGLSFAELFALYEKMAAQDRRIVFDSTRPMADEFWNLIDGKRTAGEIAEQLCLQFNFDIDPTLLLAIPDKLAKLGHIALD